MNLLINFLNGLILEKELIISDGLASQLAKMNHPVANHLLKLQGKADVDFAYIDKDTDKGLVSYITPKKDAELSPDVDRYKVNGRQKLKIGRLVRAVLHKEQIPFTDQDIESFVSKYVGIQEEENNKDSYEFKLVFGEDVRYWYSSNNYYGSSSGSYTLYSCMSKERCQNFLDVYVENNKQVGLLILLDTKTNKLLGRALVWNNCEQVDKSIKFTFMDRIYSYYPYIETMFINYAKQHNWYYKSVQDKYSLDDDPTHGRINDGKASKLIKFRVYLDSFNFESGDKPYMDTLKYYSSDYGYLTNDYADLDADQLWESEDGLEFSYDASRFVNITDDEYEYEYGNYPSRRDYSRRDFKRNDESIVLKFNEFLNENKKEKGSN